MKKTSHHSGAGAAKAQINNAESLFIVGLGASAGGIGALRDFFAHVTADSGLAYVVILHLSPDHDSQLAAVLQPVSKIPVSQVREATYVKANNVYVISPNMHLEMNGPKIELSPNLHVEERRAPVDIFFRTLAVSHGPRAICVVLSGTGANGSMGLKHIKEKGGAAFVQNPKEAEFNEMPRNSIATNLVDEVMPVAEIPAKILEYKNNYGVHQIQVDSENRLESQQSALREIFSHLRVRTGHDFLNYKRATLLRRIERRMIIRNLQDLPAYASFMQDNPEETVALLKDVLISVTNFYRDPKAFDCIEKVVLPRILAGKRAEEQVRIWVAGCATGEEAYSIAMLCAEKTLDVIDAPKVQIFATDIDETAVAHAREGLFTINDAADISAERLRRFFTREGESYRVRREIREMVLFARHNFLSDPPFSHLDMVSCRNVLIYLNHIAQERVMETFHFALRPGAYLFLGSSESAEVASAIYAQFDKEHHIFQSRQVGARAYPIPDSVPLFNVQPARKVSIPAETESRIPDRITFADLHQHLLEQYAPPSLIINEEFEIVHMSEKVGLYLQIAGGEPTQNLLKLIRQELRLELRSALYQSVQRKAAVEIRSIIIAGPDNIPEVINIHVKPVFREDHIASGYILVIFETATDANGAEVVVAADEPVARHLEDQLIRLKTQLRNSVEQHEFQAEELKASNEELQAMNEELRSAAEELETSKEELQSINEELRTVNQELKIKIEETTLSGNNLQNLINSAGIGTIFLDRSMRVMLSTPSARSLFNLIQSDFGRPLSDITNRLDYHGLLEDAEIVLEKLQPVEKEVSTTDKRTFMMRILPYRTAEDRINGVVITFVDITVRKEAEQALRASELLLSDELKMVKELHALSAHLLLAPDLASAAQQTLNAVCALIGAPMGTIQLYYPEEDVLKYVAEYGFAHHVLKEFDIVDRNSPSSCGRALRESTRIIVEDVEKDPDSSAHRETAAKMGYRSAFSTPLEIGGGKIVGVITLYYTQPHLPGERDLRVVDLYAGQAARLIERLQAEDIIRKSEARFRSLSERMRVTVESATDFAIIVTDANGSIQEWNKGAENILGYEEAEVKDKPISSIFNQRDQEKNAPGEEMLQAAAKGRANDERWHRRKDGSLVFMSGIMAPIYDNNELSGFIKIARDITVQKQAETALKGLEERYRIALKSAEMGTWDWNIVDDKITWNEQHFILLGLSPGSNEVNYNYFLQFLYPEDTDIVKSGLQKAINEATVFHAEFRIIQAGTNEVKWMSGYGRGIETVGGRINRMVGVMYDITERKKLEKEKDEFINIASHELKTPLTSIKAYAEILEDVFTESSDVQHSQYMKKLNAQIDRLNDLITDLLDTTKVAEGHLPLHPQTFKMEDLIEEKLDDIKPLSIVHQFLTQMQPLPPVTADKDRIGQVLINFLSNAIKYSPEGGTITIKAGNQNDMVQVSVQDNGIGIRPDMQAKVFDRFFRVSDIAGENTSPGMGLGLFIAAGIIRRHGGQVYVQSKPGKGSTFSFTLPLNAQKITYEKNNTH